MEQVEDILAGPPAAGPDAAWARFRQDAAAHDGRLLADLRAAIDRMQALVGGLHDRLARLEWQRPVRRSLPDMAAFYREHLDPLLLEPVEELRDNPPALQVREAFDRFDRAIEQLIRALPDFPDARAAADALAGDRLGWRARMLARPATKESRAALLAALHAQRAARRALEGRLLVALEQMSLDLLTPWRTIRRAWLSAPSAGWRGNTPDAATLAQGRGRAAQHAEDARETVAALAVWQARLPARMAQGLLRGRSDARLERIRTRDERHQAFLAWQSAVVQATLALEARLAQTDERLIQAAHDSFASIAGEHQALLVELNGVVEWLARWHPGEPSACPSSAAEIVPAAVRQRAFAQAAEALLLAVPETIEVSARLRPAPGMRRLQATQAPRLIARQSLESVALPVVGYGLRVLERQHRDIVLEMARAREVVAFARQTAREGEGHDSRIEREGADNARSLLQFRREATLQLPPEVAASFVGGLARAFDRTYSVLDEGQFGLWRYAARDGLPRAARRLARRAGRSLHSAGAEVWQWGRGAYRGVLVSVGWVPAPPSPGTHVVARSYLTRTLGVEAKLDRLPAIYQRLFRLAPVDDPRFLIGRQEELTAIADARALWEQGRDAAVLLVGARGSGKTSLINCAAQRALSGPALVRADFVERLTTAEELNGFLARLLGVAPEALERELLSGRRVIVLEELERTYLRRANGYGAIRALLGLISRTSRQNLWIISVNHSGFRLLNAALRLEPHFSHQINAMAVEPPHLREAILMRHHLSGLRLHFAPPREPDTYARRLLRAAGAQRDPESEFFETLYRESGGVFRTAFALWQRHIDRAEGGVLYMERPARPAYEAIVDSLDTRDLFTLAALLQHGSLTPAEHSLVFRIDDTTSRAWLDNLLARELIEPDPGRYGLRVVPEAAQIVRQTLFRRNLG